jgi:hypothetical protein
MPIIAAPLPAIAVLGLYLHWFFVSPARYVTGFVLAGVPVYYITHRSERELPAVFGKQSIPTPISRLQC